MYAIRSYYEQDLAIARAEGVQCCAHPLPFVRRIHRGVGGRGHGLGLDPHQREVPSLADRATRLIAREVRGHHEQPCAGVLGPVP